jgi:hypothetical protein
MTSFRRRALGAVMTSMLVVSSVAGCSSGGRAAPDAVPEQETPEPGAVPLSGAESLSRISMALRGVRPSVADLERVTRDPVELDALTDEYLSSRGFGEAVRDLFNEALNLRVAAAIYPAGFAPRGSIATLDMQRINVAVTEAPLRLIEYVVRNDRPLTEIVTADYTLADSAVAAIWGLPYSGSGESWEVTRYADSRPVSGILSDSWLYTRHSTTFSNKNRGRANAVSRGLLCYDFLSRKIELDSTIDLADPEVVANAIEKNATCASCHQTLDPLAGHFGAFHPLYVPGQVDAYPFSFYEKGLSEVFTVKKPGYFGFDGGDVRDLGRQIAADPRFSLCMAKRFYAYFHQLPLEQVPLKRASELQKVLAARFSARSLARAIVLSPEFLSVSPERGLLKSRPWQVASAVEDAAGFRWDARLDIEVGGGKVGRVDLMTDSLFGFEVLAGGIDSSNVTLPAHTMTPASSIVLDALVARAASHVVDSDFQWPASAKLLTLAAAGDTNEAVVRDQLAALERRLYGAEVTPGSADVDAAFELFQQALTAASKDTRRAWKTTVVALLSDARFHYY